MSSYDPLDEAGERRRRSTRREEQPGLFDTPTIAHQPHSNTSKAAALAIQPKAGTLRARVLRHLEACGSAGATDEELQVALNMNASTERPRRIELEKAGLVEKTDRRRPTLSGRSAAVYVAVERVA